MTIPDDIIEQIDPAETGRCGCLVPEIEDDANGGEEDDGGEGCPPPASDDSEDGGTPGPARMDAACVAADGTVSASPTTRRTSDGVFDQIWRMMMVSPVPVSAMSLIS